MSADTAPAAMPSEGQIIEPDDYGEYLRKERTHSRYGYMQWQRAKAANKRADQAEARALAAEAALAAERERVCDVTTAMCEKWIATFSGREINHTPAHEYAEGAVRDIIDQVAAIRSQDTP